ncbi:MAG: cytochrome P450 [Albidovulum sp.]|nr:cytochrome P450 [Albidovulum sp.]
MIQSVPTLSQSPIEDEFVQNPYRFYKEARRAGDLFRWAEYDRICAISNRSVNAFLRDRRWGREIPKEMKPEEPERLEPFNRLERCSMLELDPPDHTRLRNLVLRAFTSRRISALQTEIRDQAENILSELDGPEFELQHTLAEKLPVLVIAKLLGVPGEMADQLLAWSHDMVAMYQAKRDRKIEDQAASAASEFTSYIAQLIEFRRSQQGSDLISGLIAAEDTSGKLSSDEMVSTCILLLNAGHEATAYSIGNGVKTILESGHPHKELVAPSQIAATVEEVLRFDPPLHLFERHAKEDMEMFGVSFKRGDTVAVLLAAANRDPLVFPDPETFNPFRKPSANASFGAGIHFCVGAPLARLELSTAFTSLFDRFPDLRLASPPRYANRFHFHGLESLRLSC